MNILLHYGERNFVLRLRTTVGIAAGGITLNSVCRKLAYLLP